MKIVNPGGGWPPPTDEEKVKQLVKGLRQDWGLGFAKLGPDLQKALVRAAALAVISHKETIENTPAGRLATAALQWEPGEWP